MRTRLALVCSLLLLGCTASEPPATHTPPPVPAPLTTLPPPVQGTPQTSAPRPPASPGMTVAPASETESTPAVRPTAQDARTADLQELLDGWLAGSGAPGAVLGLRLADGDMLLVAAGRTDDAGGSLVELDHRFRIGSITKTFVAVLLVQLADEGLLKLDDPLDAHLAWAPHADRVTVRQLLSHTSGMPDFAVEPAYRQALLANPGRAWTARETVELIAQRELLFAPGSRWSYSNTNYTLAGLVAEERTGQSLAELLRERISVPAGLLDTYLEGLEEAPPIQTAGHFDIDADGRPENVRIIPYTALVTSGAAAGGLSSTVADVVAFMGALAEGRLVGGAGLEQMTAPSEASPGYGLGLSLFQRKGRGFWGHAGALPGYTALAAHVPEEGVSGVALVNQTGADVQELLEDAFALLGD